LRYLKSPTNGAGQPIVDYEVFFNTKDQSWQAVAGDGQGVIIINEVTKDRADKIYNRIGRFQAERQKLSLDQLKKVELRRLRQLEEENAQLKRIVADLTLDKQMLQDVLKKKL